MITVGMCYNVNPGKEKEFENCYRKINDVMRTTPGFSSATFYKNVQQPQSYLIVSEWTDNAAFESFTCSDSFKNVCDWNKTKILSGKPEFNIYGSPTKSRNTCAVGANA